MIAGAFQKALWTPVPPPKGGAVTVFLIFCHLSACLELPTKGGQCLDHLAKALGEKNGVSFTFSRTYYSRGGKSCSPDSAFLVLWGDDNHLTWLLRTFHRSFLIQSLQSRILYTWSLAKTLRFEAVLVCCCCGLPIIWRQFSSREQERSMSWWSDPQLECTISW